MELHRSLCDLENVPGPVVIAIGVFDGLHLGHRAVIGTALETAERQGGSALVLTFDPHPVRILKPDQAPRMLTSKEHKVELLRRWGVPHVLVLPFSLQTAQTPPENFVRELAERCRPLRAICVGETWSFGRERRGNLALLRMLGGELGFEAIGVAELFWEGNAVSSTRIRQAVAAGDWAAARMLLGRDYAVTGTVVEGRRIGRTLGFPTANISLDNEQLPPLGVYTVRVLRKGIGRPVRGVANVGCRPTVAGGLGQTSLEVHLLDDSGDFYGEKWEVEFLEFLRPEKRFSGLDALRAQITCDVEAARDKLRSFSPAD
jgi:riboflavin kinase/FMN adenylyltransferase